MRTCANVAHGLGGRGGHEPLPEAGEFVCDCYEHGTGEPWAHVGSSHVHEQVVRCRDCRWYQAPLPSLGNVAMCKRNVVTAIPVVEDGFCAWGVLKEG